MNSNIPTKIGCFVSKSHESKKKQIFLNSDMEKVKLCNRRHFDPEQQTIFCVVIFIYFQQLLLNFWQYAHKLAQVDF